MSLLFWGIPEATIIFIIVFLIVLFWWYRKRVGALVLTVGTDRAAYVKGETANIGGSAKIGTTPLANETVALAVTPPSGDSYSLPSVKTGADGSFTSSWGVPTDAVEGSYILTATCRGASKTSTFTLYHQKEMRASLSHFPLMG